MTRWLPPATTTRIAVPKSGCQAINSVGVRIISINTSNSVNAGGNLLSCMYQATIIGTANFNSSEG